MQDLRDRFIKTIELDAVYAAQVYTGDDVYAVYPWSDIIQTEVYAEAMERIQTWMHFNKQDIMRIECLERLDDGVHFYHDVYYSNL